jgi:hypothetical protein
MMENLSLRTISSVWRGILSNVFNPSLVLIGNSPDIVRAAYACGFHKVYLLADDPILERECLSQFGAAVMRKDLAVVKGDRKESISRVLSLETQPLTFVFDNLGANRALAANELPVVSELGEISKGSIAGHSVVVNGLKAFEEKHFGQFSLNSIIGAIREIDPLYSFSLAQGDCADDVLIARLKRRSAP